MVNHKELGDSEPIRVLIADDHILVTEGLKLVLARGGLEVIGVASSGQQAVDMTLAMEPDVLLLDIRMPDMDGFQALAAIKDICPKTSIIILTSYANPTYLAQAIALGAAGFLSKDVDAKHIPQLVRAVATGEAIVDRELIQAALKYPPHTDTTGKDLDPPVHQKLTDQEIRVLTLIAQGLNNATIAATLELSPNTVKNHVHNILVKLGVSDRTQAATLALRNGLVE